MGLIYIYWVTCRVLAGGDIMETDSPYAVGMVVSSWMSDKTFPTTTIFILV